MGQHWDDTAQDPVSHIPAPHRAMSGDETPTVVDGHVTRVSERPPRSQLAPYDRQTAPGWSYSGAGEREPQPEPEPSALSQPFPVWLTVLAPVVMVFTLALAYVAEVYLLGADWATGALAASLAALALAVVTVIVLIARVVAGRRAIGMVALAALLTIALTGAGVAGISQISPLRMAQGKQFEANHQWQAAIDEYAQAGESAPNAPDVARAYTEWGEQLATSSDFAGAVSKLTIVTQTYAKSGAIVQRGRADLFNAYVSWIRSGATTVPFAQAITFLNGYVNDPACDTTCKSAISGVSGQAHFELGQQLLTTNQYKQAISEFELVQLQFATSSYSSQAHAAAAQAYLALGKQTLSQDCASAIPIYQTLAKTYGDTSEGKQAIAKLAAPVAVSGAVSGAPSKPPVTFYLSLRIDPSHYYQSGEYHTGLSASGAYSFPSVKPGVYYPTMLQTTATQIIYSSWPGNPGYAVTVTPLCAFQVPLLKY